MDNQALRIAKSTQQVTLWVHPEGRVLGSMYLHPRSNHRLGEERPAEVLNAPEPFFVLRCDGSGEARFYSKRSVVRLQYMERSCAPSERQPVTHGCRVHMMDGSLLEGLIREHLPLEHARLFDYINIPSEAFMRLHVGDGEICLVNKAYIVRVTPQELDDDAGGV